MWFLLPVSLLAGEHSVEVKGVPFYAFEAVIVLIVIQQVATRGLKSYGLAVRSLPMLARVGLLLFLFSLIPSFLIATDSQAALGVIKSWVFFPLVALFTYLANSKVKQALEVGVISFSVVQTGIGIIWMIVQDQPRLQGLFISPNFYAACAAPAALLALRYVRQNRWIVAVVALLIGGVLLSQSLGGFLGLVGGLVFLGLHDKKVQVRKLVGWGVIGMLLLGGVLAYKRFYAASGTSLDSRQEIWKVATTFIQEEPLAGIGIKGFHERYEQQVGRIIGVPVEWSVPEPHNLYMGWWLNFGLAGLLGMLCIVVSALKKAPYGLGVVLVGVLVHGLVDTPFFKLELALLFWLYIALLWSSILPKQESYDMLK